MKYLLPLIIAFGLYSCQLMSNEDWFDLINGHETDPAIVDTCTSLEQVTTPQFVSFCTNLDGLPQSYVFTRYGDTIDLVPYLSQYGEVHYFISGINLGGTITGTSNALQFNTNIFCVDGFGIKTGLAFNSRALHFMGALTFDQYWIELTTHPSVKLLTFYNTGYTCDQFNQILNYLLDQCLDGQGGKIYVREITNVGCTIPAETIQQLKDNHWKLYE